MFAVRAGITEAEMCQFARIGTVAVLLLASGISSAGGQIADGQAIAIESLRRLGVDITLDEKHPATPAVKATISLGIHDSRKHAQFSSIRELKTLKEVSLVGLGVSDALLEYLTDLPRLERVHLGYTFLGDEGLKHLSHIKSLKKLDLALNTYITDRGIRHLGRLINLEELSITESPRITGAGLIAVRRMTKLRELNLTWTRVTDDGVLALGPHPALESVILRCTYIGERSLDYLGTMRKLRDLDVDETVVTTAAANAFRKARREVTVQHTRGILE